MNSLKQARLPPTSATGLDHNGSADAVIPHALLLTGSCRSLGDKCAVIVLAEER